MGDSMMRTTLILLAVLMLAPGVGQAQDVRPLAPILEPLEPGAPSGRTPDGEEPSLIPLPQAPSRSAAASRDRVTVAAVLPTSWTGVTAEYQPVWAGVTSLHGLGLHRWSAYFTAAALSPVLAPHPFFSPWGLLSYDGWVFDRYRSAWRTRRAPPLLAEAAAWLQRGDRAMLEGRYADAATAYRRVAQAAPDFPLGYLALGAALAAAGDDEGAARAFHQSLDHYPAGLGLNVDWELLYGGGRRLAAVEAETVQRAQTGGPASRFVAGVVNLFGNRPALARRILQTLPQDPHAATLLSRGPR